MVFTNDEPKSFHRFLDKFKILDSITWTEDIIDQSIKSVCGELENDNIDYAMMDFSINKYMSIGWHKHEAIKFIKDRFDYYRKDKIGLIISIKYESMLASQRQYSKLIENGIVHDSVIGIDLVGDEEMYDHTIWSDLLKNWVSSNKLVRAHVGEFGPEENITTAIKNLSVTNIAHGIKISDNNLIQLAIDNNIYFDLGLTSNYFTGVVTDEHPIANMINHGLKLTLGTDDPIICSTNLDKEYELAAKYVSDTSNLVNNAIELYAKYKL
jgi:adenosine deaminase